MPPSNAEFARLWFDELWNKGNEGFIDQTYQADATVYGFPQPDSVTDVAGFRQTYQLFHQAFSEIHLVIEDQVAEGDKVANRWSATGKHTGDALGFPATGKPVTLHGLTLLHISGGRVTKSWNFFDFPGLVASLRPA